MALSRRRNSKIQPRRSIENKIPHNSARLDFLIFLNCERQYFFYWRHRNTWCRWIVHAPYLRCRWHSHVLRTLIWVRCECRVRSLFERVRSEGKSCSIFCAFRYQIRRSLAMVPSAFVGGTPLICAPRHCDGSHFPFCHSWQSNLCHSRRPHRPLHTICSK